MTFKFVNGINISCQSFSTVLFINKLLLDTGLSVSQLLVGEVVRFPGSSQYQQLWYNPFGEGNFRDIKYPRTQPSRSHAQKLIYVL